jgi:hypothetical protein
MLGAQNSGCFIAFFAARTNFLDDTITVHDLSPEPNRKNEKHETPPSSTAMTAVLWNSSAVGSSGGSRGTPHAVHDPISACGTITAIRVETGLSNRIVICACTDNLSTPTVSLVQSTKPLPIKLFR